MVLISHWYEYVPFPPVGIVPFRGAEVTFMQTDWSLEIMLFAIAAITVNPASAEVTWQVVRLYTIQRYLYPFIEYPKSEAKRS